jgi:hypothetical protein
MLDARVPAFILLRLPAFNAAPNFGCQPTNFEPFFFGFDFLVAIPPPA